jgi:hypothetical protein
MSKRGLDLDLIFCGLVRIKTFSLKIVWTVLPHCGFALRTFAHYNEVLTVNLNVP